jgi:NADH-quinone oxidoreductase subunit J
MQRFSCPCLLSAAGVWMLLQAEFLAIALILIYVGAVMVLFLFVVMMLDINLDRLREGFWSYLPLGSIIALLMVTEMAWSLVATTSACLKAACRRRPAK